MLRQPLTPAELANSPRPAAAEDVIGQFLSRLRSEAVNVQSSGAVEPPFGAVNLSFSYRDSHTTAGIPNEYSVPVAWSPTGTGGGVDRVSTHLTASSAFIAADVPEPFPSLQLGMVWVDVSCIRAGAPAALRVLDQCRWTVLHNGAAPFGCSARFVSGTEQGPWVNGGGVIQQLPMGAHTADQRLRCPLWLRGGDELRIRLHEDTSVLCDLTWMVQVWGWMWPEQSGALTPRQRFGR